MSILVDFLQEQGERWIKNEPASSEAIASYEEEAKITFPAYYRDFLLWSNGGTLRGPKERFELDDIEYMYNYLDNENLQLDLHGMIVFGGSDDGGIYFFDPENRFRRGEWAIYWGQMGNSRPSESRFAGKNAVEVGKRIVEGVDFFSEPKIGP